MLPVRAGEWGIDEVRKAATDVLDVAALVLILCKKCFDVIVYGV